MSPVDKLFYKILITYAVIIFATYIASINISRDHVGIGLQYYWIKYESIKNYCAVVDCIFRENQIFYMKFLHLCATSIYVSCFIAYPLIFRKRSVDLRFIAVLYILYIVYFYYIAFGNMSFEKIGLFSLNLTDSYISFYSHWIFSLIVFWPFCMYFCILKSSSKDNA